MHPSEQQLHVPILQQLGAVTRQHMHAFDSGRQKMGNDARCTIFEHKKTATAPLRVNSTPLGAKLNNF